jgi:hypothetical protein
MSNAVANANPPHVDVAFNDPQSTYVLHRAGNPEPTINTGRRC